MSPSGLLLPAVAVLAASAPPSGAPASQTSEFAVLGWVAVQVELAEAREALRGCLRDRRAACTSHQGRVGLLEQQLRLLRNFVNMYCSR